MAEEPPSPGDRPTSDFRDEVPTADFAGSTERSAASLPNGEQPGDAIGPFTLLEVIGEGGFGSVWLAERREPMVQRVALKIIKPGMDSKAVVARFEQERQALAVMDHPNVARVFDGGVTQRGRPYFVMEYVKGEPISAYADRRKLTLRERLELFIPVCEAVQHAHHKGLIHRDLKPSNVLVAEIEGRPVPKVIDFGVAKAIANSGWEHTAHTQSGMVIGTPEYMSPEQVAGEIDVDTRSDVYSLGVMLYELLTGELPFDAWELRRAAFAEIQRIIREVTPPKPSARLIQLVGERTTTIAESRSVSRDRLTSELRRELDWIPLMALRKERERRYESPQALADDLRRYLDGQALRAAPESRVYLAKKFVRRNRVQVIAGASVFLALAAGLVVSLWQRSEAIAAQRAEATQRALADQQRDIAESVNNFLNTDLLGSINPELENPDIKVVDVLDRAAARIDASLKDKPAVRARVLRTIGQSYLNIGRPAQARPLLQESLKLGDELGMLSDDERDEAILAINECLWRQRDSDAALALLNPAIAARRARLGDSADRDPLLGTLLNSLGGAYKWADRFDDALKAYSEALAIRTRILPPDSRDVLGVSYNMLGIEERRARTELFAAFADKNEPAKAAAIARVREVRDRMLGFSDRCARALGPEAPLTLAARTETAYMSNLSGDFEAGIRQYSELLPLLKQHLTDRHWRTLEASGNLADAYRRTGRHAEAAALLAKLVELYRAVRGPAFNDTATITDWYSDSLAQTGDLNAAAVALERLFDDLRSAEAKPARLQALAESIAGLHARREDPERERQWRETAARFLVPP